MFPILFKFPSWIPLIGDKAIHTYGLMAALGFLAGLWWIRYESKRTGINSQKMMDLFFYVVVAAIVGSRLFYVFISVDRWWEDPLLFFKVWEGGLTFYGGLIAAVLVSVWYCKKNRIPFFSVADLFTPAIALGHAMGRLGCFAAGCCYGREAPAGFPLSVVFPETEHGIAPVGVPLYPTQLFEFAGELLIFVFLFFFRRRKKFEGELFLVYLILYPILRLILETFRGDKVRGALFEGVLSTAQFVSLIWIVLAILLWATLAKRKRV